MKPNARTIASRQRKPQVASLAQPGDGTATVTTPSELVTLPISDVRESSTNPRTTFGPEALDELAASVRAHGVLQPILVRRIDDGWELIAGARRLRAAHLAGLSSIPAHVVTMSDQQAREAQIIENLQREDVHPLDEAEAYERLLTNDPAYTVEAVAGKIGKSAAYVYGRLTLLRLVPDVREAFRREVITPSHAHKLAGVPAERQADAFRRCFFNLLATEGEPDRNNLAPMRQLDEWLRTQVALDVHHEDTKRLLPELAEQVSDQEQSGASLLALSTLTHHTDVRDPKPILARSWKLAEGRASCAFARPGVIVLGEDRGRLVRACVEKKRCRKHWGRPSAHAEQAAQTKSEAERGIREREHAERERRFWQEQLRPALINAIADKALRQTRLTRPIIVAALEALTSQHEELAQCCGSLAKLPQDRFAGALLIALALRDAFHPDRLTAFAKGLQIDVKRLRRALASGKQTAPSEAA